MIIIKLCFASLLFLTVNTFNTQPSKGFKEHCVTHEEMKLYTMINNYRGLSNLPAIPLSKSLSYVAKEHTMDLQYNLKTLTHSWSNCEYKNDNPSTYPCMWEMPKNLTNYNAYGYECLYFSTADIKAQTALESWKKSPNHNNVIVNKGIWKNVKWNAIGVGIYKNYAAIWFGEETDTENTPIICE